MDHAQQFYINGAWVAPSSNSTLPVINPATEEPVCQIALGAAADVDRAVAAAHAAFESWAFTPLPERLAAIERLLAIYTARNEEMAQAISLEMGAPMRLAREEQAPSGSWHIQGFLKAVQDFPFEHPFRPDKPASLIRHEPVGVCALITPWNWPMNQVVLKVVAAAAAGCTMVLKPSEIAPLSALLFAEFVDAAGFAPGVFNLVNGDGPGVGAALCQHKDVAMISLTGSCRAGAAVSHAAADDFKRVSLELGGKGANLVFADCDLPKAVARGVRHCMENTGQSCNAPTRMLVEATVYEQAIEIAELTARNTAVGDPSQEGDHIGPQVSQGQWDKVQGLIETGIREGARLVAGGPGRPEGFNRGYYTRPTVFADVTNDMTIAREEIFGPVLSILRFESEEEAIRIANDTDYGLTNYIQTGSPERARRVARRLRSGMVHINGAGHQMGAPFGGMKHSGIGREAGRWGIEEFLEVKAVQGWM
ncbi:MAG: aldehyde dehydrogenase family protein [Neomegalonema sp.]|nr:aldehyde dehydrogenase family protein [Neomegalonema sp.]